VVVLVLQLLVLTLVLVLLVLVLVLLALVLVLLVRAVADPGERVNGVKDAARDGRARGVGHVRAEVEGGLHGGGGQRKCEHRRRDQHRPYCFFGPVLLTELYCAVAHVSPVDSIDRLRVYLPKCTKHKQVPPRAFREQAFYGTAREFT
jgi:hypothetical protein